MGSIKQFIIKLYTWIRHPKSISLERKGIRYSHYFELNKRWLTDAGISTILDVGANIGDFAKLAREVFPEATIYSLEPLPDCFEKLTKCLPGDTKFFPMNIAAGSAPSVLNFYRSFHSPSSSFLQMSDLHKEAFPQSHEGQAAQPLPVQVDTLDNLFKGKELKGAVLVKLDVQGFESEVIMGAPELLGKAHIVLMEMSFVSLYSNLPLFHDIYLKMYDLGFRYRGNLAQMLHATTGEVVQVDAIFVRA